MRASLLVLLLWAIPAGSQEIGWLKLEQAKAIAGQTGKLILVYVACDPRSGAAPCSGGAAERSFADPAVMKRQDDYHFVRVCEKKTAQSVKATKPPEAIFLDADGDEVYRGSFTDGGSLEKVMTAAAEKYAPRDVRWSKEMPSASNGKTLLVVAFDDEKGESLKAFEDKTLVKYQDRIEFVRYSFKKDVEAARKWGAGQTPTVFFCDACKEAPEKNLLDKLTGRKNAAALKASIQKALAKIEPKK